MRFLLMLGLFTLLFPTASFGGEGMAIKGAKDADIISDCRVTAKMTVKLMQSKPASQPEKLMAIALKSLKDGGYKGSFGEADFLANMYVGLALQSDKETDDFMVNASAKDIEAMIEEHEVMCIKDALKD
ncbi:hypothetical protein OR1_02858 [Geobacter sp. OR-1]|uniref:hypothetical protein n=1 Tax=Geobacter sp. OR-1 TaxID=1266765 RepID=UPI0005437326|nr:hypothetical protein [Geobacter sp. OR-1]GAM10569.1 hypothetical protein OR1_02858 [Geobacter sp. OR-1]